MTKRFLLAVLAALTFGVAPSARADGPGEAAETAVASSVNALRASESMAPLRRNADLDEAALLHAEDMASHHFVAHESPRSGDPAARVRSVGARVTRVGENVARAASTDAAVQGLADSAAHRAQILAPEFTDFGVAVVEAEDGFYVVEVFATMPSTDALPPPAVSEVAPDVVDVPPAVADVDPEVEFADGNAADAQAIAPDPSVTAPSQAAPSQAAPEQFAGPSQYSAPQQYAAPSQFAAPSQYPAPSQYAAPNGVAPVQSQVTGNAPTYAAYGPQYGGAPSAANPPGAPYVTLQEMPAPNVQGYWINYGGRWWYFPIPAGARPGQVLVASPSVQGTPPGYVSAPSAAPTYANPTYAPRYPQPTYANPAYAPRYPQPNYAPPRCGGFGIMRSPRRC